MASICTAVDSVGKLEFGGKTRPRCLSFVDKYLDIITSVGFGGAIRAQPGGTLNVLDPIDHAKTKNITEVVYDILRCSLIHEADLPFNVQFTSDAFYGVRNGVFLVPPTFFYAMLFAVVASPKMNGKLVIDSVQINWRGKPFPINQLMGDTAAVRIYLGL